MDNKNSNYNKYIISLNALGSSIYFLSIKKVYAIISIQSWYVFPNDVRDPNGLPKIGINIMSNLHFKVRLGPQSILINDIKR